MIQDDYLACPAYQNQTAHQTAKGFVAFTEENEFYFALVNTAGEVLLRSEGYTTEKSRENGIKSVTKNLPIEGRITVAEVEGQFFVVVKAGNRKEIARSCEFSTAKKAAALAKKLAGGVEKAIKVRKARTATKASTKATTAKKTSTTAKAKTTKKTTTKAKAKVTATYLPTEAYFGHERLVDEYGETGYALFEAAGAYYFVVYNYDGSIYQKSVAYPTAKKRDAIFKKLQANIESLDSYQVVEKDNLFYAIIKDEKDQVISCSEAYFTFTDAYVTTPAARQEHNVGTLY